MAKREARMISLGYGKFVKADRVYALVPIESGERGDGRRTYVHVDGLSDPIVASRSERAILADVEGFSFVPAKTNSRSLRESSRRFSSPMSPARSCPKTQRFSIRP